MQRCTRSVALHPISRATPDQNGCNAYGSGAPPPTTSTTADISSRHTQAAASDAATRPRHAHPDSEREALHPLRRDTPVTSRCTRSEGVQCLRIGCTASHNKRDRGQFLPTDPNRPPRTQPHGLDMLAQIPRKSRCTRYVVKHPLRRETPVTSRYTRSVALHPLRRDTPVTSRYTRYVAIHPIRRGVMPTDRVHRLLQQAQLRTIALRSHTPGLFHERHARGTTPDPSHCTRSVALHPNRRGVMPTDRVHRLPQQARLRAFPHDRPQPAASDAATHPRNARQRSSAAIEKTVHNQKTRTSDEAAHSSTHQLLGHSNT